MASSNSCTIISKRREKLTNQRESSVDRISNLPDSVLLHIISFLPTKNAVATGLLSKRWEFLWTNVPSLDFGDNLENDSKNNSFSNFVNRVLLHHNAKSIQKFNVKFGSTTKQHDVQSWVFMAISRNVQELNIEGCLHGLPFDLPRCVFTCKTLASLKLCGRIIKISVPTSVCLPNLKTLDLDSVRYQDDESVYKLISSCFVLENLFVRRDGFDNVEKFRISAPALKRLKVDFTFSKRFSLLRECVLEINGPALEYLDIKDYMSKILVVTNLGSLIKADVDSGCWHYYESLMKCLEAFSNAKFLSLSGHISMGDLNLRPGLLSTKFSNLAHLSIGAGLRNPLLHYFLESSDSLEVLKIKIIKHVVFGRGWKEPEHVPRCLLTSLRTISIQDLEGSEDELAMLKYILKNGKVLETVEIHHIARPSIANALPSIAKRGMPYMTKEVYELNEKIRIVQNILKFPRGSEACEVTFT